ncbi:MAG: hypothetical protein KGY99_06900 [Phycisphaerae bacterium]|nr:hypothetical protein [Phycisphaerae bacterium]
MNSTRRLVITVTAACAVGGLVCGCQRYTAEALLHVNHPKVSDLENGTRQPSPQECERMTAEAAVLARRPEVLEKAATDRDVQYTRDFRQTSFFERHKDHIVAALQRHVSITPVADANLIRVSVTGDNPEECAIIANAVAAAAEKDALDRTIGRYQKEFENLHELLHDQEAELAQIDGNPTAESARLRNLQRQQAMVEYNMRELNRQIAEARREKEAADAAKLVVQQYTPEQFAELPEAQFAAENDPIVRSLRSQLSQLRAELENARRKFHDEHLVVKNLQTRRDSISEQLRARVLEVAQMLRQDRLTAPDSYAEQLEKLAQQRQKLETDARQIEDKLAAEGKASEEDRAEYESALVKKHARINRMRNRLLELQLLSKGEPPLTVISPARPATRLSRP